MSQMGKLRPVESTGYFHSASSEVTTGLEAEPGKSCPTLNDLDFPSV